VLAVSSSAFDPVPTFGWRSGAVHHSADDRSDQWRLLVRADFVSGFSEGSANEGRRSCSL